MINVDLKQYHCSVPFNSLEIHNNVCFVCCPSWLPNNVDKYDRYKAELQYIQTGVNWKPYSYFIKDKKDKRIKNNIITRFSFNKII